MKMILDRIESVKVYKCSLCDKESRVDANQLWKEEHTCNCDYGKILQRYTLKLSKTTSMIQNIRIYEN